MPDIDFYDVGHTWTESTPTFEQKNANLKIMGGDADVDNFLKATRSNIQDLEAAVVELKAKALKNKFEDTFIYGDSVSNAKQSDGLRKTHQYRYGQLTGDCRRCQRCNIHTLNA